MFILAVDFVLRFFCTTWCRFAGGSQEERDQRLASTEAWIKSDQDEQANSMAMTVPNTNNTIIPAQSAQYVESVTDNMVEASAQ